MTLFPFFFFFFLQTRSTPSPLPEEEELGPLCMSHRTSQPLQQQQQLPFIKTQQGQNSRTASFSLIQRALCY